MTRRTVLVLSCTALALLAVCCLFWWWENADDAVPARTGSPVEDKAAEPRVVAEPRLDVPREEVANPRTILTRRSDGVPLGAVAIHLAAESQPAYPPNELQFIGTTDGAGSLAIPWELDGILIAAREGYIRTEHLIQPSEARIELALETEATLNVRCKTRDGKPVAGAVLRVWRGAQQSSAPSATDARLIPGGDHRSVVHTVMTNANGLATVRGLALGRFSCWVRHPHLAFADGMPRGGMELQSKEQTYEFTFDPIVGFAARVVGDLVSWRVDYPSGLCIPGSANRDLEQRRSTWTDERADIICVLGCPKYSKQKRAYEDVSQGIVMELLCGTRGWLKCRQPLVPIEQLAAPTVIDLSSLTPASDVTMGRLQISMRLPSGGPIALRDVFLRESHVQRPGRDIPLRPARDTPVPAGSYRLVCFDPGLSPALPTEAFEVLPGQRREVELTLRADVAPVSFRLRNPDGSVLQGAAFWFESGGRRFEASISSGLGTRTFWLPVGEARIEVLAPGCEKLRRSVAIPMPRGAAPLVLEWDLARQT